MQFVQGMKAAALAAAVLVAAACGSTPRIGQAQDAFNEGARIEAAAAARSVDPQIANQAADSKYELALNIADAGIQADGDALAADKLLGVAYTVKAMAQWRLGDLRDDLTVAVAATKTVRHALDKAGGEKRELSLGTRDAVLFKALEGVADVVRARLSKDAYDAPDTGPRDCCKSALAALSEAVAGGDLPADHSIRVWVGLCRLRACEQWMAAISKNKAFSPQQMIAESDAAVAAWKEHAGALKPFFRGHEKLADMVRLSGRLMGLDDTTLNSLLTVT